MSEFAVLTEAEMKGIEAHVSRRYNTEGMGIVYSLRAIQTIRALNVRLHGAEAENQQLARENQNLQTDKEILTARLAEVEREPD